MIEDLPFEFTCPKCGSHYFGRDVAEVDGKPVVLKTVRCHADSSGSIRECDWHSEWPIPEEATMIPENSDDAGSGDQSV